MSEIIGTAKDAIAANLLATGIGLVAGAITLPFTLFGAIPVWISTTVLAAVVIERLK